MMVIYERIREIGVMGSLGMTRFEIVILFLFEGIILGIIGSILGTIFGGIIVKIFTYFPFNFEKMTGGFNWASNTIYFSFSWIAIFKALVFGIIVTTICSFLASLKAAFIEPIEALRR